MKTQVRSIVLVAAAALVLSSGNASAQSAPRPTGGQFLSIYPGKMIGRVDFQKSTGSFMGSATVIKPYSILTCGHNLFSRESGWSRNFTFKRGYYHGTQYSINQAAQLVVLSGYTTGVYAYGPDTPQSFQFDLGGAVLRNLAANGSNAGWWANPAALTSSSYTKLLLGYGANPAFGHNGEEPLYNITSAPYQSQMGMWLVTQAMGSEGGMSGGPVMVAFNNNWYIAAVHVSGPNDNNRTNAGCRAIDSAGASLINSYLR